MSSSDSRRRYSSELRARQAEATRERVLTTAIQLFAEQGFAGTTMPQIAKRAGVSTETVQANGPKLALLREAIDRVSFGGDTSTDVRTTPLGRAMLAARNAGEAARVAAAVLTQVNAAGHGLWLALSEGARQDDSLAAAFRELATDIRAQTAVMLEEWAARGFLRTDLGRDALLDKAVLVASVELYDRYVRVEGRSVDHYTHTLAGLLEDVLVRS